MIVLEVPAIPVMHHVQICPSRKQTQTERNHERDAKPHGQLLLQRPPVSPNLETCPHRTNTNQERALEVPRSAGGTRASDSQYKTQSHLPRWGDKNISIGMFRNHSEVINGSERFRKDPQINGLFRDAVPECSGSEEI